MFGGWFITWFSSITSGTPIPPLTEIFLLLENNNFLLFEDNGEIKLETSL